MSAAFQSVAADVDKELSEYREAMEKVPRAPLEPLLALRCARVARLPATPRVYALRAVFFARSTAAGRAR